MTNVHIFCDQFKLLVLLYAYFFCLKFVHYRIEEKQVAGVCPRRTFAFVSISVKPNAGTWEINSSLLHATELFSRTFYLRTIVCPVLSTEFSYISVVFLQLIYYNFLSLSFCPIFSLSFLLLLSSRNPIFLLIQITIGFLGTFHL
jgi:hypothetical protein